MLLIGLILADDFHPSGCTRSYGGCSSTLRVAGMRCVIAFIRVAAASCRLPKPDGPPELVPV